MKNYFLTGLFKNLPGIILLLIFDCLFTTGVINDIAITYFYSYNWFFHILAPYLGASIHSSYYEELDFFIESIELRTRVSQEGLTRALLFKTDYKVEFISHNKLLVSTTTGGINRYKALIIFLPSDKLEIEGHTYLTCRLKKFLGSNKS